MPPKVFDNDAVNKKSSEQGATLTNDGKRMYFSSDRAGGLGGHDIYYVQRLPTGAWSAPVNLGDPINTVKDEVYPLLMNEGATLYFSSDGHPGMGDKDLYKSTTKDDGLTWSKPTNLGYPINTPDDDLNISFAKNMRYAYMAKNLDDSFGDLDIYRLTFEDERDDHTLLTGRVLDSDSSAIQLDISMEIFSDGTGEMVGTYKVDKRFSKYSAILAPGMYVIEVMGVEGYADYTKNVKILGKNDLQKVRKFDIILESK